MSAAFKGAGGLTATCTFRSFTFRAFCDDLEFKATICTSEDLTLFHFMTMNTHNSSPSSIGEPRFLLTIHKSL
jgi:hypothetical protein